MTETRRLQTLGVLSLIFGGVAVWFAYRPENLLCPHERIIPACNPNFFYLIPGIVALLGGFGLLVFAYRRRRSDAQSG